MLSHKNHTNQFRISGAISDKPNKRTNRLFIHHLRMNRLNQGDPRTAARRSGRNAQTLSRHQNHEIFSHPFDSTKVSYLLWDRSSVAVSFRRNLCVSLQVGRDFNEMAKPVSTLGPPSLQDCCSIFLMVSAQTKIRFIICMSNSLKLFIHVLYHVSHVIQSHVYCLDGLKVVVQLKQLF